MIRKVLTTTALLLIMGCSATRPLVIYPIEQVDIQKIPAGASVFIPAGSVMKNKDGDVIAKWDQDTTISIPKDGRFLSNFYIAEVMEAKEHQ